MKKLCLFIVSLITVFNVYAQSWSTEQLQNANTAKNISYLTNAERDAIMYINLARLYPKEFVQLELIKYEAPKKYGAYLKNSSFKKSLINQLNHNKILPVLTFDEKLYADAKCFAEEMGNRGEIGHSRRKCAENNFAECCSYGMETGLDIAMQWLIDHDVTDCGHRKICLDLNYSKIAICIHPHKKWAVCAVAEII